MRVGRVDEIHLSNFLNVCDSKFNLLKIRDNYIKIRTLSLFEKINESGATQKVPFGATLALRV